MTTKAVLTMAMMALVIALISMIVPSAQARTDVHNEPHGACWTC